MCSKKITKITFKNEGEGQGWCAPVSNPSYTGSDGGSPARGQQWQHGGALLKSGLEAQLSHRMLRPWVPYSTPVTH